MKGLIIMYSAEERAEIPDWWLRDRAREAVCKENEEILLAAINYLRNWRV